MVFNKLSTDFSQTSRDLKYGTLSLPSYSSWLWSLLSCFFDIMMGQQTKVLSVVSGREVKLKKMVAFLSFYFLMILLNFLRQKENN